MFFLCYLLFYSKRPKNATRYFISLPSFLSLFFTCSPLDFSAGRMQSHITSSFRRRTSEVRTGTRCTHGITRGRPERPLKGTACAAARLRLPPKPLDNSSKNARGIAEEREAKVAKLEEAFTLDVEAVSEVR